MLDLIAEVGTWICLLANAFIVLAKLARADFVLSNIRDVALPTSLVPYLAGIEGLGVVGLALGLWRYPAIGLAAAIGLVAFFAVAMAAHVRAHRLGTIGFPGAFLLLAALATWHFA